MGDCACDVSVAQQVHDLTLSTLYLELTTSCNSACPGCGSVNVRRGSTESLSISVWQRIIDKLAFLGVRLRITGGEPTLHPEFETIVAYMNSKGSPYPVFQCALGSTQHAPWPF